MGSKLNSGIFKEASKEAAKELGINNPKSGNYSFTEITSKFAAYNQLITRDMNNIGGNTPTFSLYSKDQITSYLKNPYSNAKNLRNAITYIYGASSHFRRLIQYFVSLSDLSYVISPYKIDTLGSNKTKTVASNYRKTMGVISSMNLKSQLKKILTVCLREDTFYGTLRLGTDNIIIQQLPPDFCDISVIENNVLNVTFDFSYFDANSANLPYYSAEMQSKYKIYQGDRNQRWQTLDAPTSFAIKCNDDILAYPMPPFAGILREIYDLEDYKQLKMTKTALENYALLVMHLGINEDGDWVMDYNKAKDFWGNLDAVLPEEIGSILTPMPIDKISFERTHADAADQIAEAEQSLFSAAGVSSLLFNNEKASANALSLSVKADQAITFKIVKSIEDALNRYVQSLSFGKNFKINFLDCSPFNRAEVSTSYLQACQYGMPMISHYAAAQGLNQSELDAMNFLENDVLSFTTRFKPLQSSSTMSSGDIDSEAGAPEKTVEELTDSGEISSENQ